MDSLLKFHFLTLFPEVFKGPLESSLLGKAEKRGLVSYDVVQIRDFARDKHKTVDDTPFGGGEGMVMKPDVLYSAWQSVMPSVMSPEEAPQEAPQKAMDQSHKQSSGEPVEKPAEKVMTILLSPQGQVFDQDMARELSTYSRLILICGHYEGVDERFVELCVDREVSIGNYVLTGGELPALAIADSVTRLIPGVVGNTRSLSEDSLEGGLLKYPQYTRPREFMGKEVPPVLLGGDHQAIHQWREAQKRERTARKRPDLWSQKAKDKSER